MVLLNVFVFFGETVLSKCIPLSLPLLYGHLYMSFGPEINWFTILVVRSFSTYCVPYSHVYRCDIWTCTNEGRLLRCSTYAANFQTGWITKISCVHETLKVRNTNFERQINEPHISYWPLENTHTYVHVRGNMILSVDLESDIYCMIVDFILHLPLKPCGTESHVWWAVWRILRFNVGLWFNLKFCVPSK